ncbi:MAG: MFS transporter, partial [Candidatus Eiseniibacteriota bacterium]
MNAVLPRWRAFPVLAIGVVMATLDISVVNIALPTLSRTFGVPLTRIEWVVLGYVVTITGLLLTLGRVADRAGRRRVYGLGLAVFAMASGLCGAAPSAATLIAARVLQGTGAAMMSATSVALLVASFPPDQRGRALGAFGAMVGVGLAIGTPLGGFVVAHASWRWLFFINLPLALAAGLLLKRVPEDAPATSRTPLDLGAAATWCAALVSIMLALSRGPELGWGDRGVWPLFAISLFFLGWFGVLERRSAEPLLPLRLVQGPLGILVLLTFLSQAFTIGVGFHLPLYLEEVLGLSAE